MRIILILLYIFIPVSIYTQNTISGTIKEDATDKQLNGVIVSILNQNNETLEYQITDNKGSFSIDVSSPDSYLVLSASLLGYETKTIKIKNETQKFSLFLPVKDIDLKEVSVESRPVIMSNDTLRYSVNAFKSKQDRSIGDVLKKLPGIEVMSNGAIKYKGEAINKFYINGMDLLDMKYGLATENLPADAVTNVEVLENHQPLKVLKDISSTGKAAINLRLSEKVVKPVGVIETGGGTETPNLLWLMNVFMLKANKTNQTLVYYKTNNHGNDISKESIDHSDDVFNPNKMDKFKNRELFNVKNFDEIPLIPKRYLFNKTHAITINNLKKINQDKQLRINLNYLNDTREENTSTLSSYYLPDKNVDISESNYLKKRVNILDGAINYNSNAINSYLNNKLKMKFKWEDILAHTKNEVDINQKYNVPQIVISNEFQYVKKKDKNIYDISSFIRYTDLPQRLRLTVDTLDMEMKQKIDYTGLYTINSTNYTYHRGNSFFHTQLSLEGAFESLSSNLHHPDFINNINNRITTDFINIMLDPSYTYRKDGLSITPSMLFKQHFLFINDKEISNKKNKSFTYIQPQLSLRYRLNAYWEGNVSYRYNKNLGDIVDLPTGIVMHNYRIFESKSGILSESKSNSVSLRVNYRNPLKILFINTLLSYRKTKRNLINSQYLINQQSIISNRQQENNIDTWMLNTYISKYVSIIKTTFAISGGGTFMKSEKMQQSNIYPLNNVIWFISPSLNTKISDNMNVQYQANYNKNILEIRSHKSSTQQFSQLFNYFYTVGKFELKVQYEQLYNEVGKNQKDLNIYFLDFGAKYVNKQFELGVDLNNILNQKKYGYTIFNGLDTYTYNYRLRPSNIIFSVRLRY